MCVSMDFYISMIYKVSCHYFSSMLALNSAYNAAVYADSRQKGSSLGFRVGTH